MSGRLPIQTRLLVTPIDTQLHMHAPIHESNLYSGPHALVIVTRTKPSTPYRTRSLTLLISITLRYMSHESRSVGNAILNPCTVYEPGEPWGEPISGSETTRCE